VLAGVLEMLGHVNKLTADGLATTLGNTIL
jgi:hypothetical protein